MDDDECSVDLIELIDSIKKHSLLWKPSTRPTTDMRKLAWNQVAAETGIDVGTAKRKWNDLIDSVVLQKEYPNPGDKLWSVLYHMQFLPEADKLLKSIEYDQFGVELKIERLDDVGNEHQAPEKETKTNFDKGQPPRLVKLASHKDKTAPTKNFRLVNLPTTASRNHLEAAGPSNHTNGRPGSENENAAVLKQLATVCDRFADAEFGYGMHVAQQLRELPMQNREMVRQKINTLLYDEFVLGAGNNVLRTKN